MPQQWAGQRMLPAASVPRPSGEPPAAMIAASPPLLPPGVRFEDLPPIHAVRFC